MGPGQTDLLLVGAITLGAVVLFASALFFAGVSTKLHIRSARVALLAIGWVVFLGTVIWLATLPIQLTV